MTDKEKKLAAYFLKAASDVFGIHICNDVDEDAFVDWTIEERQQLVKDFHEWNGDPEEYNPNFVHLPDHCLMSLLASKLENVTNH
jgi:hypothetical protein